MSSPWLLPGLLIIVILIFFKSKHVSLAFPIHSYTFLATRIVLVEVLVGKHQEKTGVFKNVSKKYIKAIFSVLMDKVIYDKFTLIYKVDKSIY